MSDTHKAEQKSSDAEQHDEEVWNKDAGVWNKDAGVWNKVLGGILAVPGVKVDRANFLRSQLNTYCDEAEVIKAIESSPAKAGISSKIIDKAAKSCIKFQTGKSTAFAFLLGLPGGWAMAAALPADLVQFYAHAFILCQQLAYLYGWPNLDDEVDDETKFRITMFLGVMLGVSHAQKGIKLVAEAFAKNAAKKLPKIALTKTSWYPFIKSTARWFGVSLTKNALGRGVGRVIPVLGGFICGGINLVMMKKMANRLQRHLKETKFAQLTK